MRTSRLVLRLRPANLLARARADVAEPLFRDAYSLLANAVLTSALGLLFWILAARTFAPELLGRDSALVSAMVALSSLCQLNLQNTLVRFLPERRDGASRMLLNAYGTAVAATLLGALVFVLVAPAVSVEYDFLVDEPLFAAVFVASVAVWTVFGLQDAALTALGRSPWVPLENGAYGVLKLAALPVLVAVGAGHGVFAAWMAPVLLVVVPVNALLFLRVLPAFRDRAPALGAAAAALVDRRPRDLRRFLVADGVAQTFSLVAAAAPPLLVLGLLGSEANAFFTIPYTIVTAFDLMFVRVTTSIVAEGARMQRPPAELVPALARRFAFVLVPGVALIVLATPLVLLPFGDAYVDGSSLTLELLVVGSLFRAVIALETAGARLTLAGRWLVSTTGALLVLRIGLTFLLAPPLGIEGVAVAWLASNVLVAVAVAPRLVGLFRAQPPAAASR